MSDFLLKMAGYRFAIHSLYPSIEKQCAGYCSALTDGEPVDETVTMTEEDIAFEEEANIRQARVEHIPAQDFPPDYLETVGIHRKIAEFLSHQNAALFHGALIELDGEGYLFTAKSGTGKTTHIRNWFRQFPNCHVVNGDKPVLRIEGDRVIGYGTPWAGKEGYQNNTSVPVRAIILLGRDTENHIEPVRPREAISGLIVQTYRAADNGGIARTMQFLSQVVRRVDLYRLGCNMDPESALVAYRGMQKGNE